MLVSVIYYDDQSKAYCGRDYTYRTNLPLKVFEKVICPTYKGDKRALVTDINLPESSVDPAWADRLREITKLDNGEKV
jgi:hypothetical protein